MRIELELMSNEVVFCGACGELQSGVPVYVGDTEDQSFAVLCASCVALEEAAIADAREFMGVAGGKEIIDDVCHEPAAVVCAGGCSDCCCGKDQDPESGPNKRKE